MRKVCFSYFFFFTLLHLQCRVFSELFLATTIVMLTPVACCYMISFNYGGKKSRGVVLTCRCHLNKIMPGSIFYDSIGWGMSWVFLIFRSGNCCLPQHRRNGFSLITITPMSVGKPVAITN